MPVEKSANMLLIFEKLVQILEETDFLESYWNLLDYQIQKINFASMILRSILDMGTYAILRVKYNVQQFIVGIHNCFFSLIFVCSKK